MKFNPEVEAFIKDYVNDMAENRAAIFAGAGLSKKAGFVNWPELLRDIAHEVGLDVDKEHDLISLAQYHANERGGRAGIIKKILNEFSHQAEPTDNHEIIARLPISSYWTTNYDRLIETGIKDAFRIVDVKHSPNQLTWAKPKRDAVVYKMHGDVDDAQAAILTKQQYEMYYKTHEAFTTILSSELLSKTFLFLGFSFTDPNLDYVLSRLNIQFGELAPNHYTLIKKESRQKDKAGNLEDEDIFKYRLRKQELMVGDLKRYKIKTLLIDDYADITKVLLEIENRFRKRTIFISGSAEEYGVWDRNQAQTFIHSLSKNIVSDGYRIVNGFGWGVGSAVVNGALDAIYDKPEKISESQLIMKPFPQFKTGTKELPELWAEYRERMIALAGIVIFVFGNKTKDGKLVPADGVEKEFVIALNKGLIPIPVAATGYITKDIYEKIINEPTKYYPGNDWIVGKIKELADTKVQPAELVSKIIDLIKTINK